MVGGGVRHDCRVGAERNEGLVAFIYLCNGIFALPEPDCPLPTGDVRAVDAHRVEPACRENVAEHRGDRRLAASAYDCDELVAGERSGEGLRTVGNGDSKFLGTRKPGIRVLNRSRHDHLAGGRVDSAAVVREAANAESFEKSYVRSVEIAIGAGHLVAKTDKRRREGAHADATDADEMTLHWICIVRCS